ncbi:hypothetical protein DO72_5763 [Burkholderia pseudomallei]|nr:hypothetical protein DO72_5763 [Burkholderia pseudomallei]
MQRRRHALAELLADVAAHQEGGPRHREHREENPIRRAVRDQRRLPMNGDELPADADGARYAADPACRAGTRALPADVAVAGEVDRPYRPRIVEARAENGAQHARRRIVARLEFEADDEAVAGIDSVERDDFPALVPIERMVARQFDADRIDAFEDPDAGDRRGRQLERERLLAGQIRRDDRLLAAVPEKYLRLVRPDLARRLPRRLAPPRSKPCVAVRFLRLDVRLPYAVLSAFLCAVASPFDQVVLRLDEDEGAQGRRDIQNELAFEVGHCRTGQGPGYAGLAIMLAGIVRAVPLTSACAGRRGPGSPARFDAGGERRALAGAPRSRLRPSRARDVEIPAQLLGALRDARRGPRQQIAVDREQIAPRDRGQLRPCAPAREVGQCVARRARARRRRHDRLRIRREHRFVGDGRRDRLQPREHVAPAAQRDHVAHDVIAVQRDERFVPRLEEHRDGRLVRVARAQLRDSPPVRVGRGRRDLVRAQQQAELVERCGDIVEMPWLAEVKRNAERAQPLGLVLGVAVAPDDDQIGLERRDPFEIERLVRADARNRLRGGRVVAVRHRADELRAAARRIDQLGHVRREAHDAPCGRGERDRVPGVVGDGDVRMRGGERMRACARAEEGGECDACGAAQGGAHRCQSRMVDSEGCAAAAASIGTHSASVRSSRRQSSSPAGSPMRTLGACAK